MRTETICTLPDLLEDIEHAINQAAGLSKLPEFAENHARITELGRKLLHLVPSNKELSLPDLEKIVARICWQGEIAELHGKELGCRKSEKVVARQFFYLFARIFVKKSLKQIGAYYDQDHATVLHAIKIRQQEKNYPINQDRFNDILKELVQNGYTPLY